MTYYLDTTIQLTKLFGPSSIRQRIKERITSHSCVVSHYAQMEYLRWLEPSVYVYQLLKEEIDRNPKTALSETQARILLRYGRNQNKMLSIMTWLLRTDTIESKIYLLYLKKLIDYEFHQAFTHNVTLLPDPIACPLMNLHAISQNEGYRLEPDISYQRGQMPCHIVDFLQIHHSELAELAPALDDRYPKIAEACRRVLTNPGDAQGNICKTLGDVIIALQTPDDAVLWTTDASFDVICSVLGIACFRERLVG